MNKMIRAMAAVLLLTGAAEAKWWIFGKSNDAVSLKYLYINRVPADESGKSIKLFKETLPSDGTVKINGRAQVGRGRVGSIRISLDDKEKVWQDVKFADNGTFEHAFKPQVGRTYVLYVEVTDTAGKTNLVEDTRKEITLSEEQIQAAVREALDEMFAAYSREDLAGFMARVGDKFAGDKAILETAVKKDFDALNNIRITYTINNIGSGAQGRVFVSITYNRLVFVTKTGQSSADTGFTEFVFDSPTGKLALFSMKQPLMFGLSDADNVATGEVLGNTGSILTLDDGDLTGALTVSLSNPDRTSNTVTYTFADNTSQLETGFATVALGDIGVDIHHIWVSGTTTGKAIVGKSLSDVTMADLSSGLSGSNPLAFAVNPRDVFGFKVGSRYYAIEIVSNDLRDPSFNIVIRVRAL